MAMSFLPKMLYSSHLFTLLQKKRSIVLCVISSFIITSLSDSLCYVSQDFWRTQVSADSEKKKTTSEMSRLGAGKWLSSFPYSIESQGVCFSHFFMRFVRGPALVCIGGMSVTAKCPQGESRLYVKGARQWRYTKGVPLSWKMVYKTVRGWTSGGASPYKNLLSSPPPPPFRSPCRRSFVRSLLTALAVFFFF